ncbi:PPE family protein [Mycobacterium haemophilum DSM 44634]|uniref:PPE family protein n=1 Tax=Mycobacterium haemophilum TaxID=29311 RepID=UPI0006D3E914|nr:PPE family protein [Mycobacterium haemophilum]ALL56207.1 hypothetical protein B586_01135 [Mycobacterium haemophilum DSM 44634]MCV7342810.1 PPE family protein [Mycobacterium haemophilum DSM 44634]
MEGNYRVTPPEVTARAFYAGPGADSLWQARSGWEQLANDLQTAAKDFETTLKTLTRGWQSAAALQMTQATAPYLTWLRYTTARVWSNWNMTTIAFLAYQTAHNRMVPPQVVAANIARRQQLHQTNQLGQNTHAIAAAQAQYQGYWDTNASAMENYRHEVADAMRRVQAVPFVEAPKINGAGSEGQHVNQVFGSSTQG